MSNPRLEYLFQRWLDKTGTAEEQQELMQLLREPAHDDAIRALLDTLWQQQTVEHRLSAATADTLFQHILAAEPQHPGATVRPLYPRPVRRLAVRVAVAAAVLLVVATGAYFLLYHKPVPVIAAGAGHFKNDIAPGRNNAILTLSDGREINLDSSANGRIAQQGNSSISKQDGELSYTAAKTAGDAVLYNTVRTARGNQYKLVLPDGSRVWLNAESSIRFQPAFSGHERRVEMTGEAYFEVKHDSHMPFVVVANGVEVHDIGTTFNINAYTDEPSVNTTLVEGAARVVKGNGSGLLKPGQQAQIGAEGIIKLVKDADVAAATAWKNGQFMFQGNNIQSVMRQLERWYDIEVQYSGNVTKEEFVGSISRFQHISEVLLLLEKTRTVSFEINGRKVTVK